MEEMLMTQVDLGNIRPEGVAAGPGSLMYTSELLFGGIKSVDVVTGQVTQVVPSFGFGVRAALGLWYAEGVIYAGGAGELFGPPAAVHAYDAHTGQEIVTCTPASAVFVNDVIEYNGYLFATDSFLNEVLVFDVGAMLHGDCSYNVIVLPEAFVGDGFRANGIEIYKDGIIVANSNENQLWYIDLHTYEATMISAEGGGDGLLVDGDILYSVENVANTVAVYQLGYSHEGMVTATPVADLTSDLFRIPTTVAMYKDMLYLGNAVSCFATKKDEMSECKMSFGNSQSIQCFLSAFNSALTLDSLPRAKQTLIPLPPTLTWLESLPIRLRFECAVRGAYSTYTHTYIKNYEKRQSFYSFVYSASLYHLPYYSTVRSPTFSHLAS